MVMECQQLLDMVPQPLAMVVNGKRERERENKEFCFKLEKNVGKKENGHLNTFNVNNAT